MSAQRSVSVYQFMSLLLSLNVLFLTLLLFGSLYGSFILAEATTCVTSAVSFSSLIDMGKLKKSALTAVFLA